MKMKDTKKLYKLAIFIVPIVALMMGATAPAALAGGHHGEGSWLELEEAHLYFELNDTDGDLGIHGKVDGGPWKYIQIKDPYRNTIMSVSAYGRLKRQGLTELFFESAEPSFDDLSPEKFFKRFPEGTYKIYGKTLDGKLLSGASEISHVMPASADGVELNGHAVDLQVVDCDDEDTVPEIDVDSDTGGVTISWAPVMNSHPDLGEEGEIVVALYQVVVEVELEVDGEEFTSMFSADLPPDVTEMTVPAEFIELGEEFKYEILVREAGGGNQTAVESCFIVD
jgi:hypothetical protein